MLRVLEESKSAERPVRFPFAPDRRPVDLDACDAGVTLLGNAHDRRCPRGGRQHHGEAVPVVRERHPEEFLEFATAEERNKFEVARTRRVYELLEMRSHAGRTAPITGALRAWEEAHVPGREAYLAAFSDDGIYGAFLRSLPVAIRIGEVLFVHGGLTPRFAERGLKRLDELVIDGWAREPQTALDLTQDSPLAAEDGPLWCRSYAAATEEEIDAELTEALDAVRSSVMVVGHTRTDLIGGKRGHPLMKHSGRLICADVGIGSSGGTPAALVIDKDVIWAWRPDEKKKRLRSLEP